MEAKLVYLFKKRKVKQQVVYETKDVVYGFYFTNKKGESIFHIITGKYAGEYADYYGKNINDAELTALETDIDKGLELNDNKVDFEGIRSKLLSKTVKYYVGFDSDSLTELKDKEILAQLECENKNGFNEDSFEKETDISKMYSTIKQTIISQDEQIMQILTSIYKNQVVANSKLDIDLIAKLKENILIYGPTGTGKTEIIKRIAK